MQFIYAIDGCSSISAKTLETAGLKGIIRLPEVSRGHTAGPGGVGCVLVADKRLGSKNLQFIPAEQTWARSLNDKFWIGFYTDSPPAEAELKRDMQIDGHPVELQPGNKWRIPLARVFPAGTRLPQSMIMVAGGQVQFEIEPGFIEFSKKAERLWDDFLIQIKWAKGEEKLSKEDAWWLVTEALKLNYHVGADEVNALKLLSTRNFEQVICAIVDVPTLYKFMAEMNEKKNLNPQ